MSSIMGAHLKSPVRHVCRALIAAMAVAIVFAHVNGLSAQTDAETDRLVSCMVKETTDQDRATLYPIILNENPTETETNTAGLVILQKMLRCGVTIEDVVDDPDYLVEVSHHYGVLLALDWLERTSK